MNKSNIMNLFSAIFILFLFLFSLNYTLNNNEKFIENCLNSQECLFDYLFEKEDFNVCFSSKNETLINFCLEEAMINFKQVEICKFTNNENFCYDYLAYQLDDYFLCYQIKSDDEDFILKDNCIFQIAFKLSDINICKNSFDINKCELSYVISKKNEDLCFFIELKEQCLRNLKDGTKIN